MMTGLPLPGGAGLSGPGRLDLPERARVLVITLRRIGDVLLTTPLIRTVRRALPHARIEVLVFRGGEGILAGNPDIDNVLTSSERPSLREILCLIRTLWRRYDLVLVTQPGDRPTFLGLVAGRQRVALVPRAGETGAWWKRHAHPVPVPITPDVHRIPQLLQLSTAIGFEPVAEVVCPAGRGPASGPPSPYAVLHPSPFYAYKRWNDAGWRELAAALIRRGLSVALTGSPDPAERVYLDALWPSADAAVHRLDGRLDWPQLVALLRGAEVYVGPDTSMTHLAAATGCPTVALFGPTSPQLIGPWPVGGLSEPWAHAGTLQRRGNVWVVQHPLPCLPCEKLGCDGHLASRSQCLDELSARVVVAAVEQALLSRQPAVADPS